MNQQQNVASSSNTVSFQNLNLAGNGRSSQITIGMSAPQQLQEQQQPSTPLMKRTHSIEVIEPNKRPSLAPIVNTQRYVATASAVPTSVATASNDNVRSKYEMRDLLESLKAMFPQKRESTISKVIYKHKDNLDINRICNDLIEDKEEMIVVQQQAKPQQQQAASTSGLNDLQNILQVIPDCDPVYIESQLKVHANNPHRVDIIVSHLFEMKNYPRLKDKQVSNTKQQKLDNLLNMSMNIEDFLKVYPNPFDYFYAVGGVKRNIDESYKEHCMVYLSNKFSRISAYTIGKVFAKHNYLFVLTIKEIEFALSHKGITMNEAQRAKVADVVDFNNNQERQRKKVFQKNYIHYELYAEPRRFIEYPYDLDEKFFKELFFYKNENLIKDYITNKKIERERKILEARQTNSLRECECCYNDEILIDDMIECDMGHAFCIACVKKYIETSIGEGKTEFKCMDTKCNIEYNTKTLSSILEPNVLSSVLRRMQQEEIRRAGLENLEMCKYCDYAAVIDNPNEKVFACMNPECLKETCRLCHELNHIPLRCDEVENRKEVNMRIFIENKVTEAMIRVCYQCKKRFFKQEGCNHMKCACGAEMCYVCKQPIRGYTHFKESGTCQQHTDVNVLHQQEMKKAYDEAVQLYKQENPQAENINLRYDPKKILDELSSKSQPIDNRAAQLNNIVAHGNLVILQANQLIAQANQIVAGINNDIQQAEDDSSDDDDEEDNDVDDDDDNDDGVDEENNDDDDNDDDEDDNNDEDGTENDVDEDDNDNDSDIEELVTDDDDGDDDIIVL